MTSNAYSLIKCFIICYVSISICLGDTAEIIGECFIAGGLGRGNVILEVEVQLWQLNSPDQKAPEQAESGAVSRSFGG